LKLIKDEVIELYSQFKNFSKPELYLMIYWMKISIEELEKILENKKQSDGREYEDHNWLK